MSDVPVSDAPTPPTPADLINFAATQVQSGVSIGGAIPSVPGMRIDPVTGEAIIPEVIPIHHL